MFGKYSGNISYWMEGQGPPIVLIHGLGSSKEAWFKNIQDLSKSYTCFAIDLPGYGDSYIEGFDGEIVSYADFLVAFFELISVSEYFLAGHSMGALIASFILRTHPEKVKKAALIAPAGFEKFNAWQQQAIRNVYVPELTYHLSDEVIKWNFMLNFFQMPSDVTLLIQLRIRLRESPNFKHYCKTIEQNVSSMLNSSEPENWSSIMVPCSIIYGLNDRLIPNPVSGMSPYGFLEHFKFYMPKAKLNTIEKAGHFVMWEQCEQVNHLLSSFLKD